MFALGIDFGTNSVRALVVRCSDGAEFGSCVVDYPSGAQGVLLDSVDGHLARQYPGDYLFGLEKSVKGALAEACASRISTPPKSSASASTRPARVPFPSTPKTVRWRLRSNGGTISPRNAGSGRTTPASAKPRITELGAEHRPQYIAKCGNTYSSEWFWSKIWHCLNVAPEFSTRPIAGSNCATGFRPCSPA